MRFPKLKGVRFEVVLEALETRESLSLLEKIILALLVFMEVVVISYLWEGWTLADQFM